MKIRMSLHPSKPSLATVRLEPMSSTQLSLIITELNNVVLQTLFIVVNHILNNYISFARKFTITKLSLRKSIL